MQYFGQLVAQGALNYVYDVTVEVFAGLAFLIMGSAIALSMIGTIWMRIDSYRTATDTGAEEGMDPAASGLGIGLGLGLGKQIFFLSIE